MKKFDGSITSYLLYTFGALILLIQLLVGILLFTGMRSNANFRRMEEVIIPEAIEYINLEQDVLLTHHWLTDVAATRAEEGFDQGIELSTEYYRSALERANMLIERKENAGNSEAVSILQEFKSQLAKYISAGKQMTRAYINSGPWVGNPIKRRLDPVNVSLQEQIRSLVETEKEILSASIRQIENTNRGTLILAAAANAGSILLGIVLVVFLTRRINSGFNDVIRYSHKLADGDFSPIATKIEQNEFGTLKKDFNAGFEAMRNLILKLQGSADTSARINGTIANSSQDMSSSVEQMNGSIKDISSRAKEQNDAVLTAGSSIDQISSQIGAFTGQIERQSANVSESSASIEEMTVSIANVARLSEERSEDLKTISEVISRADKNIDATADVISTVAASSEDILEVIGVIKNISNQTDLLAMNAAIEAAHAGEFGKGFAVVADEIRQLAEDTAENSRQISQNLQRVGEIIVAAQQSSRENKISFSKLSAGVGELTSAFSEIGSTMAELNTGASETNNAVAELSEITHTIKEAAGEINSSTGEILNSMDKLKGTSGEIITGMSELNIGTDEIENAMSMLKDLSEDAKNSGTMLREKIGTFTV